MCSKRIMGILIVLNNFNTIFITQYYVIIYIQYYVKTTLHCVKIIQNYDYSHHSFQTDLAHLAIVDGNLN